MKYYYKSKKRLLILLIVISIVNILVLTSCNSNMKDGNKKTEQYGNLMGNINNKGLAAINGQWIYAQLDSGLYKMKTNFTGEKIIEGNTQNINIWDGYIYYTNDYPGNGEIYRIKPDGSDNLKINNEESCYPIIKDGWIYYSTLKYKTLKCFEFKIKKMKINGTNQIDIVSETIMDKKTSPSRHFFLYDGWIYYQNALDMDKLYRIQEDGNNNTKVSDEVFNNYFFNGTFIVNQNWIYYTQPNDYNTLYRMKIDGTEKELVFRKQIGSINITDDYIYYSDWELYRRNKETGEEIKLADYSVTDINVIGDWIYCRDYNEPKFYMIRCDGSEIKWVSGERNLNFFLTRSKGNMMLQTLCLTAP